MYKLHRSCRACGYAYKGAGGNRNPDQQLIEVLDLGIQPLANDFQNLTSSYAGYAPLKVLFCPKCTLAQLSVVVDPHILYDYYSYVTSPSDTMRQHFGKLWEDIQHEQKCESVLEIGSNTGDLLQFVRDHGAKVVQGVDPAANLCQIANEKLVPTNCAIFDEDAASQYGDRVDAVIARHVFCHVDDWRKFMRSLKLVGHTDTLYCIENPYAPDTLAMNSWDQIYHEHLSFLTLKAMKAVAELEGFHLHRVIHYSIHGGAVMIMLRRNECEIPPDRLVEEQINAENVTEDSWRQLAERSKLHRTRLVATINGLREQGKNVVGFGASAKSTVWINACGLTRKQLSFVCDSTPQKWYRFIPGTDIPVTDEGALMRELPHYAVCFAWNFMPEIVKKQNLWISKGGRFVVPVPEITIVPSETVE